MSKKTTTEEIQDLNLEPTFSNAELQQMLNDKILELNQANEEISKIKVRSLKVYEENQLLQHSPQYAQQAGEMKFHLEMAKQFTASKAFPAYSPEQIYTLIKAGAEMSMKPLESLSSLYIIKGKIEPYGKGMIAILTKKGYRLKYTNETDKTCTVTAMNKEEGFEGSETVSIDDPILKRSNAIKIAPKNKLRFHAIRTLLNFQLPHLISSTADLFEVDALTANKDSNENTMIAISDETLLEKIKSCSSLDKLEDLYLDHKAEISRDIHLASALGKAKKVFQTKKPVDHEE